MSRIAVILALPIEYNTSSMLRCRSIISALQKNGHYIKCYCPRPDIHNKYYSSREYECDGIDTFKYKRRILTTETNGVHVKQSFKHKIKKAALYFFRKIDVFGSSLLYLSERKDVSADISKGNFDFLISFSDPMPAHMIGKYCKKCNPHIRYIQQWGDPLAGDTISKVQQPVWFRKIVENILIKPADRICYVSPFTCEDQKRMFKKQEDKMIFLPTPSLLYKEEKKKLEKLCIGYFGSYRSIARNLRPFYEAAKLNPQVEFFIIGDSDIILESTDHIHIIQRISPDNLSRYMAAVDVMVCLMNRKGNQIPGKVYHDASSNKDILFIKDGEFGEKIQRFFEKYDHYTFVDNTVVSIDAVIKQYLEKGVPYREPVKEFQAKYVAERLIQ